MNAEPEMGLHAEIPVGDRARAERVLEEARALDVRHVRASVHGDDAWRDWLVTRVTADAEFLPRVHGEDAVDALLARHGALVNHVELVDATDADAAARVRAHGKRVVVSAADAPRVADACARRVLQDGDAVVLENRAGAVSAWRARVDAVRHTLRDLHVDADVWLAAGDAARDEREEFTAFVHAMDARATRVYWRAPGDASSRRSARALVHRVWAAAGTSSVRDASWLARAGPPDADADPPVVITGGAGFIGVNLAHHLLAAGRSVLLLDDLSRPTGIRNLHWLRRAHGSRVRVKVADVTDADAVTEAVAGASAVYHLAAQVAVTTSLQDPRRDFEVNAGGTLNVLEALRARGDDVPLVFASTNKVYGAMPDVRVREEGTRVVPEDAEVARLGVSEARPLDFHTPYGCSKGAADQYVRDYARSYGIPAVVLRLSCAYGPRQFGTEDQGWVAHFLIRALRDAPVTVYGTGRQVRDVLFVDDLVNALLTASGNAGALAGRAFNVGGGPGNTLSLLELLDVMRTLTGRRTVTRFAPTRPGDQPYYVSDVRAFTEATGWTPRTSVKDGVARLHAWLARAMGEIPHAPAVTTT